MAAIQEEYNEEIENQQINEEYKIWKKNAPFLYDTVITHVLEWPSLTCQWLPVKDKPANGDYSIHRLVIGTHTSDQEPNFLLIAKVRLPNEDALADITEYTMGNKVGGIGLAAGENRIDVETKIFHEGEVNRARYMPQKYNIIATKTVSGEVHVFDYFRHPPTPASLDQARPEAKLVGHTGEGYGLSWSKDKPGHLLSGANDSKICLWTIEGTENSSAVIKPLNEFKFHTAAVQDVSWHQFNPEIFASVGDDRKIALWDLRKPGAPSQDISGHAAEINSIDFNPFDEYLFITGSSDKTIGFWDLRNTSKSLHVFEGHVDDVLKVEWEPNNSTMFASCSNDRRIRVWDISKIGQEQKAEDAVDGPPELLFIHGGHRAKIPDFSWNSKENVVIASVEEENNILQVWQMASNIYQEDEADEDNKGEMITEKP